METLIGPEDRRHVQWIDRLCRHNEKATGRTDGFLYEGGHYRPSTLTGPQPVNCIPLHIDLVPEMDQYLADKKTIDLDRHLIKQSLFSLLFPCNDLQGQRDALPECLFRLVPEFAGLSRQAPEAWSIEGNARALRQYLAVQPKIEIYVSARLIY
jgi:hypothetical protein